LTTPEGKLMLEGMPRHASIVDFFRKRLPSDSFIRPYAKRIVEDSRTLLRTSQDWTKLEKEVPKTLFVETTNICNANCVFCAYQYQAGFRPGKGVMSEEIFEKALGDYKAMGGPESLRKQIDFTPLVGEPLVDPKIVQRTRRAKEMGFRVKFFSNGILLNRINLEELLATGVEQISVSTSPFDRDDHELLYRSNGKYDDLVEGLQKLLVLRNKLNAPTKVNIQFRAHINLEQIKAQPDFQRLILPHLRPDEIDGLYAQVGGFDSWGGQIKQSDLPGAMRIAHPPRFKHRPCQWTFSLQVMYDGRVRACSCRFTGREQGEEDGLFVGDIQQQSLEEIWNGERIHELRRRFGRGDLPRVCQSCTMYRSV
jgi:MoaA/NifB/PqqE/SkfB family radical SAM enzyme